MVLSRLMKNWPYKLLAVGTAIILTSYVHSEKNPWTSASVTATVQGAHLQEGYVATLSQERMAVTLSGPKTEVDAVIESVKSGEVTAWLDLSRLQPGVHKVPIRNLSFPQPLPRDVTAQPAANTVSVTVEVRTSRTLPVEVKIKTPPPIGYAVGEPTVTPDRATISGASSLVDKVERLVVVVDPTPLRPSVDEYAQIKALSSRGEGVKGLTIAPDVARVTLKLVEAPASKAAIVSPNYVGQPRFPYKVAKVTVTPNSVTIKGNPELLAATSTVSTDDVDLTDAASDVIRYVAVHVRPGLQIEGPTKVKVTVRIVPGT